jgi:hypothetical protein
VILVVSILQAVLYSAHEIPTQDALLKLINLTRGKGRQANYLLGQIPSSISIILQHHLPIYSSRPGTSLDLLGSLCPAIAARLNGIPHPSPTTMRA